MHLTDQQLLEMEIEFFGADELTQRKLFRELTRAQNELVKTIEEVASSVGIEKPITPTNGN